LIGLLLTAVLFTIIRIFEETEPAIKEENNDESPDEDFSDLFKGCENVYFDVGSNVGVQIRKLFEPELYPDAPILDHFDTVFGPIEKRRKDETLCAFGFEANPRHGPRLKEIEACYKARGFRVHFFHPRVVSEQKGATLTFYSDPEASEGHGETDWGAGTDPAYILEMGHTPKETKVHSIDLVAVLNGFDKATGSKKKHVFMKMDIEGSEFGVLPDMLKSKKLCKDKIDTAIFEWHWRAIVPECAEYFYSHWWPAFLFACDFRTSYLMAKYSMLWKYRWQSGCPGGPTELLDLDDESYVMDGKPLVCN
jgi:hypothetical protein